MNKLLIKNAIIISATESYKGDIYIHEGKIQKIASTIEPFNGIDSVIDAHNKYVFPGGIDPHVHMHLPSEAGYSADDFLSGSKAALFGGTTTIIDFVTPNKDESLLQALKLRKKEAENSLIDYSFHVSPIVWNSNTDKEINQCLDEGISSFKVYMAYKKTIGLDQEPLFNVMKSVHNAGGILAIHCETGDEIERNRDKLYREQKFKPEYHAVSRPSATEYNAVRQAIDMAADTGCPIYIVHVSTKESLEYIHEARKNGLPVYAETCPQYLLLHDEKYITSFDKAAPFIMSPPLRKPEDNDALWKGLTSDILSSVGTDHCPFASAQKIKGMDDFRKIPNGAGGVEHRLSLLYTYGVLVKRININQLVNLYSTAPARIFGLYPQKGEIAIGSDADLVIWNPEKESVISAKSHHSNTDISIYENMPVKGAADVVIKNGKIAIKDGKLSKNLQGSFLRRKPFSRL